MTRQRRNQICVLALAMLAMVLSTRATAIAVGAEAQVIGVYALPDTRLTSVEGFITNDRNILLGSIGSDLWHGPGDPPNRFWMISDRSPNGELELGKEKRRTFPVPEFSPLILQFEVANGEIKILRAIPLVDSDGKPVGGLPNIEGVDDPPYDYQGVNRLAFNPNGLDTEGLVRTAQGDFWLADEYSPSLVHCDSNGKVLKRYVSAGLKLEKTAYPVDDCLPGILARRRDNRGFEGLTLSNDGKTLYAIMQDPLSNPDKRSGAASRNVRLLAFDIAQEKPAAEYVYRLQPCENFRPYAQKQSDLKVSGLAMLGDTTMLVLERTDEIARLYKIDFGGATNILDGRFDRESTAPALESLDDLAAAGVTAPTKSLACDLSRFPNMPGKIEGIAIIDDKTIAVANDNDFDLGMYDSAGNNQGVGARNMIYVIRK